MSNDKRPPNNDIHDHQSGTSRRSGLSRRDFIGSTTAGVAAGALASLGLDTAQAAKPPVPPGQAKQGILLKDGIVLTMDKNGQDYEKADVYIQGSKIVGIGPNIGGSGAVIDCTGKIV